MTDLPRPALTRIRARAHRSRSRAPSRRLCITAAQFGLALPGAPDAPPSPCAAPDPDWLAAVGCAALAVDVLLAPGHACLISGPSGAGKSTLLRRIAGGTPTRIVNLDAPALDRQTRGVRPPVDLFSLPLDATLRLLAAAGLAEAPLLIRPARFLSEGQRFRLRLALAMARAARLACKNQPVTIIADEFCAPLDDATAASVCLALSRWLRTTGVRLIAATPRGDLRPFLRPQLIAATQPYQPPEVSHARSFPDEALRPARRAG